MATMETDKLTERMILRYRDIQRKKDDREKDRVGKTKMEKAVIFFRMRATKRPRDIWRERCVETFTWAHLREGSRYVNSTTHRRRMVRMRHPGREKH